MQEQKIWYVTFGCNHMTRNGANLHNKVAIVTAPNYDEARAHVINARGDAWSNIYSSADKAGVKEFGLAIVNLADTEIDPILSKSA